MVSFTTQLVLFTDRFKGQIPRTSCQVQFPVQYFYQEKLMPCNPNAFPCSTAGCLTEQPFLECPVSGNAQRYGYFKNPWLLFSSVKRVTSATADLWPTGLHWSPGARVNELQWLHGFTVHGAGSDCGWKLDVCPKDLTECERPLRTSVCLQKCFLGKILANKMCVFLQFLTVV